MDFEIDQSFCLDVPLGLVPKDFGTTDVFVLLLLLS